MNMGEAMHTLYADKDRMNSLRVSRSIVGPFVLKVTVHANLNKPAQA